jgi:exopolysaccharide biosynthesis polyprenyl glycosylphosphotransferase
MSKATNTSVPAPIDGSLRHHNGDAESQHVQATTRRTRADSGLRTANAELELPVPGRWYDEVHEAVEVGGVSNSLRERGYRESIYRRSMACADAVAALTAVFIAINLLGGDRLRPLVLLVAPLIVVAAKIGGLYDKDELVLDHSTLNELGRLINLATIVALLAWLVRHEMAAGVPSTFDLLALWLALAAGLVIARTGARALARRFAPAERCLLVGRSDVFARLETKFRSYPHITLVGLVQIAEIGGDPTVLHAIAERQNIHRIIIDTDATSPAATLEIVQATNTTGLQVSLLPSLLGTVGSSVVFDDIGGLVLLGVRRFGLSRSSRVLKRALDVIGASAMILAAAPLMLILAIAIKLGSPGPMLFRQTRVGRGGIPFEMYKLRTMVENADALKESLRDRNDPIHALFKIAKDPRITRIGALLRRSCLDELPQLFNVLAGHMSLVGPRPLVVDEDCRITGADRHRLHLTPGITGRWQTLSVRPPLAEMVKIDYLYIATWSPWNDFKIMIETIGFVTRRRGQ